MTPRPFASETSGLTACHATGRFAEISMARRMKTIERKGKPHAAGGYPASCRISTSTGAYAPLAAGSKRHASEIKCIFQTT